ncbi:serine protease [Streptomyces sp. NPDC049577]|uniref:trypsin-like serine peptidase n=1 Tax=Streptomyces sp. NPDC049577 TaxID=3155153 RepID=UPI00342850F7
MRVRTRAGLAALVIAVAALAVVGLLVANRGLATDAPLADGDTAGHYRQPEALGTRSAEAMKTAVRTGGAPAAAPSPALLGAGATPTAREVPASPAVGPLFYTGEGTPAHGCTASVVHSRRGDLIVTAAHCVYLGGFRTDLAFVPGYRDGAAPYGVWVPVSVDVAPQWVRGRDPDHDVAFLRVRSVERDEPIERVTGAERIRFDPQPTRPARALGYPNTGERPLACENATDLYSPTQLRFPCTGLPNGTSGSPILTDVDAATGLGTVDGVLGGKDEGGDDETSYSSYFGAPVRALYERATR